MAPKLYMRLRSPPCRAVLLMAKALDIKLETVQVNLEDQLKPEFLKINPQHTVPTLDDGGRIIWDSHAIMVYLLTKYGKDYSLYPEDPYKRAVINQRMHFESGVLFPATKRLRNLIVLKGTDKFPKEDIEAVEQAYEFLEKFLNGHEWVAGDRLTLADFSLLATATTMDGMMPIDLKRFPNIITWIKRAQELPYYSINKEGVEDFKQFALSCVKK